MKNFLYTVVIRLFVLFIVCINGGSAESRESQWIHDKSLDELTSTTGVLWVQEGIVSRIECAITCADSDDCNAVFYNSRTQQCQGHNGTVTVSGTTVKTDNAFYMKMTTPAPSTATTSYIHIDSAVPPMVYDVYVNAPKKWYDAEATCDGLGQRLIRLDTDAKVTSLTGVLGSYPATVGKDMYVAGFGCCFTTDMYWHSGPQYFWKTLFLNFVFISDVVYKVNSGSASLQLHDSPSDPNLYVCETIP